MPTKKQKAGYRSPPGTKTRAQLLAIIDSDAILKRLHESALARLETDSEGNTEPCPMDANQIRIAEMLLKRTLPEIRISAPTQESDFDGDPANVTNAQLAAIIASASSDHAPREKASKDKPGKVRQIH